MDFDDRSHNLGSTITTENPIKSIDKKGDEKVVVIHDEDGEEIDIDDI